MWDAALVARVRDRKLNEILVFASMAKIDTERIDDYIDIIVSLGDDIDACDTLLETDGEAEISLDSIDRPEYASRLSPGERADEDAFNAMKTASGEEPEDLEYVKGLIDEAVDAVIGEGRTERPSDAEGLEWEMDGLRDAFHNVLGELTDYKKANSELRGRVAELERSAAAPADTARVAELESEADLLRAELAEARTVADSLPRLKGELEAALASRRSVSEELDAMAARAEESAARAAELERELVDARSRSESASAQVAEASLQRDRLEARVAELTEELENASSATAAAESRLRDETERADGMAEALDALKSEVSALRGRNDGLSAELDAAQTRVAELTASGEDAAETAEGLRRELEEARASGAALTESNASLGERIRELESRTESLERELSEASEKARAAIDARTGLEAAVSSLNMRIEDESRARMDAQERADRLQEEADGAKAAASEARSALEQASSQLDECRTALAAAESERDGALAAAGSASDLKEALDALKQELSAVRTRNEELSRELDFCKEAVATAESERDEARAELDAVATSEPEPEAAPEPEPVPEPAPAEPEPVADVPVADPVQASEPDDARPAVDRFLTDADEETLRRLTAMKDRQIDEFIDRAMDGSMREDVCDDIVTFLKVDSDVCRALLSIDLRDLDSIVSGLSRVLDILEESPDARFQKVYRSTLTPEEIALEDAYVDIMNRVHDVIAGRYLKLMRRGPSA